MVHFAGRMDHKLKYAMIEKWLKVTEGPPKSERDIPLKDTRYESEVAEYWSNIEEARSALEEAETLQQRAMKTDEKVEGDLMKKLIDAEDTLRNIVYGYFYRPKEIKHWIKELRLATSAFK